MIDRDTLKKLKQLEAGLQIDEHALDAALCVHGQVFHLVAKGLARAISYRDAAKQDLQEIEAQIDTKLRAAAVNEKPPVTETGFKSRVRLHKEVQEATQNYLNLKDIAERYTALKEAYQTRGFALNKLVDLYIHGYFGDATHRASTRMEEQKFQEFERERKKTGV